ncbi:MAG: flagellar hook-basal body protein [Angelakisella sp.]
MNIAFYTGVSGMAAFQQQMDITAHNIANSTTTGYKVSRASFSDLMYTQMDVKTPGEKTTGHGVKNANTDLLMSQGSLSATGRALDYAIVGDGFFALEDYNGEVKYSRNGAFDVSPQGSKNYLVSSLDGSYVLDGKGKRMTVSTMPEGGYDLTALQERLGIYTVANPYGLGRKDGSSFTVTDLSGPAKSVLNNKNAPAYELRGATLERSAVDLGSEMLNVIQAQRAYQMNSKIVQTADQMEELVNNLRT